MYKLANGWTKQTVIEQVKKYNNGTRAMTNSLCTYRALDGNRCAIGCFIPDNHAALELGWDLHAMIYHNPDLAGLMPFNSRDALNAFQQVHDKSLKKPCMRILSAF